LTFGRDLIGTADMQPNRMGDVVEWPLVGWRPRRPFHALAEKILLLCREMPTKRKTLMKPLTRIGLNNHVIAVAPLGGSFPSEAPAALGKKGRSRDGLTTLIWPGLAGLV
jgi:hypothetical protein